MAVEVIEPKACIGCDLCMKVCPVDVFRMEESTPGRRLAVIAYQSDCQTCFLCEEYCPTDAIYVAPQHPSPAPPPYPLNHLKEG